MYFPLAIQVSPELAIGPAYVILEEGQTLNRVTLAQERPLCSLETARLPVRSCVALPSYWLSPLPAFLVRYSPKRSLQCPKPISIRATRHRQGEYSSLSTQEATCRRPSTRPCRATRSCSRPALPSPEILPFRIKSGQAGFISNRRPTAASRLQAPESALATSVTCRRSRVATASPPPYMRRTVPITIGLWGSKSPQIMRRRRLRIMESLSLGRTGQRAAIQPLRSLNSPRTSHLTGATSTAPRPGTSSAASR